MLSSYQGSFRVYIRLFILGIPGRERRFVLVLTRKNECMY